MKYNWLGRGGRRLTAFALGFILTIGLLPEKTYAEPAKDPACGLEEHIHTDDCYEWKLVCGHDTENNEEVQAGGESIEAAESQNIEKSEGGYKRILQFGGIRYRCSCTYRRLL